MSQSATNQVVALTANVVATVTAPQYYERIIISNETTGDIYVSTNGQAVATAAGGFGGVVLPSTWRMMGNDQPREPLVTQAAGSTVQNTLNALASGHATVVSIMGTATGNVGIEFV